MMVTLPTRGDVEAAARRIAGAVRRTPVVGVTLAGRRVWLKLEQLQETGSFKARGATNAVLSLDPARMTVVAASGGNHGLGVAHAAAAAGITATVVVPENVPEAKARLIAALGATVVRHGEEYAEAEIHARHLAVEMDAAFLHPYADPAVICGQGTIGLEIDEDLLGDDPRCDTVVVAIGGGGLIGGIATALADRPVRVFGVEPEGIPTMSSALAAGHPVDVPVASMTASALGARRTGETNLAIAQRWVDGVVLVDDAAILAARDLLWDRCRLAVEPAAATGLAALLAGAVDADAPCVVLCGANSEWTPGPTY
jgi:threonine dehydratase